MRKRRILSLLLAVAVMATMLVAVPLTASAEDMQERTITWDFSKFTEKHPLEGADAYTLRYEVTENDNDSNDVINLTGNSGGSNGSDYVQEGIGFQVNGGSNSSRRYITYVPENDGTLTVNFSNNNSSDRWTIIGTEVIDTSKITSYTKGENGILAAEKANNGSGSVSSDELKAGTTYYVYFSAKLTVTSLTYVYQTVPGLFLNPNQDTIRAGESVNIYPRLSMGGNLEDVTFEIDNETDFDLVDNPTYATVSAKGSAEKGDSTTLTAKYKEQYTATAIIEVTDLPDNKYWIVDSDAVQTALETYDSTTGNLQADGATIGTGFTKKEGLSATYTHNGVTYNFTKALQGGTGNVSQNKATVSIVPAEAACKVTVLFDNTGQTNKPRVQHIYYGDDKAQATSDNGEITAVEYIIKKSEIVKDTPIVTYGDTSSKNLYAIFIEYFEEPEFTSETGIDSGYYQSSEGKKGVIRFFQGVNADDVSDYGFYIVDDNGEIVDEGIAHSQSEAITLTGIYADLYGLPEESSPDIPSKYTMKAFVTPRRIGSPIFAPESVKDKTVNWDVEIKNTFE